MGKAKSKPAKEKKKSPAIKNGPGKPKASKAVKAIKAVIRKAKKK